MYTLILSFEKRGIDVDVLMLPQPGAGSETHAKFLKTSDSRDTSSRNIEDLIHKDTLVFLHNVSPFHIIKAKIRKKCKVVVPIYFVWNLEGSIFSNTKGIIGQFLWQPLVNQYLATSAEVAQRLRRIGIARNVTVVGPEYSCPYCDRVDYVSKKKYMMQLPVVKMVYIGAMKPKRFPLQKILQVLNSDRERQYDLKIFTSSEVNEGRFRRGNVDVSVIKKKLSDFEKCGILKESHFFIAPTKGTTMEPPISVTEAEYHGNVIVRF
jgi:hypothetical protein